MPRWRWSEPRLVQRVARALLGEVVDRQDHERVLRMLRESQRIARDAIDQSEKWSEALKAVEEKDVEPESSATVPLDDAKIPRKHVEAVVDDWKRSGIIA